MEEILCWKVWAMPASNGDTFKVKPIREFVDKYIKAVEGGLVIDPFARNCQLGTLTNDLNPDTTADYHMDSVDFLKMVAEADIKEQNLVLFDPPYSPHQVKELYDSIGLKSVQQVAHRTASWKAERDIIAKFQKKGDFVLSFNWNTVGMGKKRGYMQIEVLVVCHGACHNDTLCVAEIKL